jgi:hypothetical protein
MDEDRIRCLPEHGACWVSDSEQVFEQVGHDEQIKERNLLSCMHCWLSHEY